jgi:hypothetical protein
MWSLLYLFIRTLVGLLISARPPGRSRVPHLSGAPLGSPRVALVYLADWDIPVGRCETSPATQAHAMAPGSGKGPRPSTKCSRRQGLSNRTDVHGRGERSQASGTDLFVPVLPLKIEVYQGRPWSHNSTT